jgi:hypothetical protein
MTNSGAISYLLQELKEACALYLGTPICIPSILETSSADGRPIRKALGP